MNFKINIKNLLIYLLIYFLILNINFYFIRKHLDSQVPPLKELMEVGGKHVIESTFLGFKMETAYFTYENEILEIYIKRHRHFMIMPFSLALIFTVIIVFIGKIIKKWTSKYEL